MAARVKIIDRDLGYKKIYRALKSLNGIEVVVGITAKKADRSTGSGINNATLGLIHEYGLGRVPERSFIRSTVENNLKEYKKLLSGAVKDITVNGIKPGKALGLVGLKVQGDIKDKIQSSIPPANAEATIKAKGSSVTLIDTGQLIGSISYRVEG